MKKVDMKKVMMTIGYYAIPVLQTIAASLGVILAMRVIDKVTR